MRPLGASDIAPRMISSCRSASGRYPSGPSSRFRRVESTRSVNINTIKRMELDCAAMPDGIFRGTPYGTQVFSMMASPGDLCEGDHERTILAPIMRFMGRTLLQTLGLLVLMPTITLAAPPHTG